MYFPSGCAKRLRPTCASLPDEEPPLSSALASMAKLGGAQDEIYCDIARQPDYSIADGWNPLFSSLAGQKMFGGRLFAAITPDELVIWAVRPCVVLCKIKRRHTSLRTRGQNLKLLWGPIDGESPTLVVQTSKSHILVYKVVLLPSTFTTYSLTSAMQGTAQAIFTAGPGEALDLPSVALRLLSEIDFSAQTITSLCFGSTALVIATNSDAALRWIDYDLLFQAQPARLEEAEAYPIAQLEWLIDREVTFLQMDYHDSADLYVVITSEGRAYAVKDMADSEAKQAPTWDGQCFYGMPDANLSVAISTPNSPVSENSEYVSQKDFTNHQNGGGLGEAFLNISPSRRATKISLNKRFSLIAIGLLSGHCAIFTIIHPSQSVIYSHTLNIQESLKTSLAKHQTGTINDLSWSTDGYSLAIAWNHGWSCWSVYGRLSIWAVGGAAMGANEDEISAKFGDSFMYGVQKLFWATGNTELVMLTSAVRNGQIGTINNQLYMVPFAKSAVASLHNPDNTKHAFLQTDDCLHVYRGVDQPDMSVINPDSDSWQHIKIPAVYIATNWPIQASCISSDGRLIAVAGRRGFTHYNTLSGRWKLFDNEIQEQSFSVCGGMQWWGNSLIVASDEFGSHSLRIFARDTPLNLTSCLHRENLPAAVVALSVYDNSLLVYTADNTFWHFLISSGKDGIRLNQCGSIGFEGVINIPQRVRGLSWLVPRAQQKFGDPADDLNVSTIIFLVDGKLVLLRPQKAVQEEVKYDMQILADKIEFYWTHLSGIGTLENSLWGWDGQQRVRVWLNALTIEYEHHRSIQGVGDRPDLGYVQESVAIPLDFYPLSLLLEKGIIVGVDLEVSLRRSLEFAIFRTTTNTHLFTHYILRFQLNANQITEAVRFAAQYQHLVYFAHTLEILLHQVLEEEADALPGPTADLSANVIPSTPPRTASDSVESLLDYGSQIDLSTFPPQPVLPRVVELLDHFPESLQVVVGCARKTEIARWNYLFDMVGEPRELFERCIASGEYKTAASYLLVLHNLESVEQSSKDTIVLLKAAMQAREWMLCKELLRFLGSLDGTGEILRLALTNADALPNSMSQTPQMDQDFLSPEPELDPTSPVMALSKSQGAPWQQQQSGLGLGSLLARATTETPWTHRRHCSLPGDSSPLLPPLS